MKVGKKEGYEGQRGLKAYIDNIQNCQKTAVLSKVTDDFASRHPEILAKARWLSKEACEKF